MTRLESVEVVVTLWVALAFGVVVVPAIAEGSWRRIGRFVLGVGLAVLIGLWIGWAAR